jgi:hypothetical protein
MALPVSTATLDRASTPFMQRESGYIEGREVRVVNNNSVCAQIGSLLKAVAAAVTALALTGIVAIASIFAMIALAEISPLTLIGTIPLGFSAIQSAIKEIAVPLFISSNASWNRAFNL